MTPHPCRMLIAFAVAATAWLCPATRAAPATSAPVASNDLVTCIAAIAGPDRAVATSEDELIQAIAKAFPLSNERLGQMLNLAEAHRIPSGLFDKLANAVERASAARAADSAPAGPDGLAHDQLVLLRAVARVWTLSLYNAEIRTPELRAPGWLEAAHVGDHGDFPAEVKADITVALYEAAATLAECEAGDVQDVWTRDGPFPRHWRRRPISDVLRDHSLDSMRSFGLVQAMELAGEGHRARADVALALLRETEPRRGDFSSREDTDRRLAALLYLRWNRTSPSFRLLSWLAGHLPGSGRPRLYLGMAVVALGFHLLQLPILLKARRSLKLNAPHALWLTAALTFTQLLPVIWAIAVGPAWVFAFDEGCLRLGVGAMRLAACLGAILLGLLLLEQSHRYGESRPLRKNAIMVMLNCLVVISVAGVLLNIRNRGLLNDVGLDVAAFMMITGPAPLAIYIGVLLRRRGEPRTA